MTSHCDIWKHCVWDCFGCSFRFGNIELNSLRLQCSVKGWINYFAASFDLQTNCLCSVIFCFDSNVFYFIRTQQSINNWIFVPSIDAVPAGSVLLWSDVYVVAIRYCRYSASLEFLFSVRMGIAVLADRFLAFYKDLFI